MLFGDQHNQFPLITFLLKQQTPKQIESKLSKINSILNFLKIGGFLPEVYIQNSKYHRGVEKQKMFIMKLTILLEYLRRYTKAFYLLIYYFKFCR